MTRAVCELASGTNNDETLGELIATVDMFELSLTALRDGMPAAGVNPPPNAVVKSSLESTYAIWQANRGIYDAIKAGDAASADDVIASYALTQDLSVGMNNAITLYLIATPGKDGIYRVPLEAYGESELAKWARNPDVIAAIRGACVGGGCGLALCCDLRFADTTAKFAITPAKLGLDRRFRNIHSFASWPPPNPDSSVWFR